MPTRRTSLESFRRDARHVRASLRKQISTTGAVPRPGLPRKTGQATRKPTPMALWPSAPQSDRGKDLAPRPPTWPSGVMCVCIPRLPHGTERRASARRGNQTPALTTGARAHGRAFALLFVSVHRGGQRERPGASPGRCGRGRPAAMDRGAPESAARPRRLSKRYTELTRSVATIWLPSMTVSGWSARRTGSGWLRLMRPLTTISGFELFITASLTEMPSKYCLRIACRSLFSRCSRRARARSRACRAAPC